MGHYSWYYENNTCEHCGESNLNGLECDYVKGYDINENIELEKYKGDRVCNKCLYYIFKIELYKPYSKIHVGEYSY